MPCEGFGALARVPARGMRAGGKNPSQSAETLRGATALRGFQHPRKGSRLAVWWQAAETPRRVQKLCEGDSLACEGESVV